MFDPPGRLCHQPENSKLFCIWMIFKSSSEMPTPKGKEKKIVNVRRYGNRNYFDKNFINKNDLININTQEKIFKFFFLYYELFY